MHAQHLYATMLIGCLTRMQTPSQVWRSGCGATRIRRWIAVSSCAATFAIAEASDYNVSNDVVIPTVYESGHFYSTPVLDTGRAMRMLVDTGGGGTPSYWINKFQADAISLTADDSCEMDGHKFFLAHLKFKPRLGIPGFPGPCNGVVILSSGDEERSNGQLVPLYFSHGVWTFDYPGTKVILRADGWTPPAAAHKTELGFRTSPGGFVLGWPRIVLTVEGQELDMLLDTGATAHPTPEGLKASGISTTGGFGVTSYITKSIMDAWRVQHPDWVVIEHGDDLFPKRVFPIIRVPRLQIAGFVLGPVWFTERPDSNFHDMMASLMDRPPEGAVGANIFEHFQMTIDYPKRIAWFDCISACKAALGTKHEAKFSP